MCAVDVRVPWSWYLSFITWAGAVLTGEVFVCEAPGVSFVEMAAAQAGCPAILSMQSSSSLTVQEVPVGGSSLLCDVSTGTPRPLVPPAFRRRVFDSIHGAAHPGMRATRRLISSRFVWPGLAKEVNVWTRCCVDCQIMSDGVVSVSV